MIDDSVFEDFGLSIHFIQLREACYPCTGDLALVTLLVVAFYQDSSMMKLKHPWCWSNFLQFYLLSEWFINPVNKQSINQLDSLFNYFFLTPTIWLFFTGFKVKKNSQLISLTFNSLFTLCFFYIPTVRVVRVPWLLQPFWSAQGTMTWMRREFWVLARHRWHGKLKKIGSHS